MIKRIELNEIKVSLSETAIENAGDSMQLPGNAIEFMLQGTDLDGFGARQAAAVTDETGKTHPDMHGWPETDIVFPVAEEDLPRVAAWFDDNYQGVTTPESPTLQGNRREAIYSALSSYFSAATSANLFTSPFRLGISFRLKDGRLTRLLETRTMQISGRAPKLPVISNTLDGKRLHTRVQIRNIPSRLLFRVGDPKENASLFENIRDIEIFATAQTGMYDAKGETTGLRSITIDGIPRRCWYYDSYTEAEVSLKTEQEDVFRRIASIPVAGIQQGENFTILPMAAGTLSGFAKLPTFRTLSDSGTGEGNPTVGARHTKILTEPLHLGYPENEKSVHRITLRGVFPRRDVIFRLYGSQHRENWRLLASVKGPYLRGLIRSRWRWLRVEIEADMRAGDFFEAITFGFGV